MNETPRTIDFSGLMVRRLQTADHAMICAQREKMFVEAGGEPAQLRVMTEHFATWLRPRLLDGRYFGFVLSDQGKTAAAIGLMSLDWPPHPAHPTCAQRGYVLNVFVEPDYRRRGLASALMNLAEAEFARRGIGFAILHATELGRPVYENLGWVPTAEMAKTIPLD